MNTSDMYNVASKVLTQEITSTHFDSKKMNLTVEKFISPESISVVIPVKNNQNGVHHLLNSILIHTEENFYPREIIIVDNNSDVPVSVDKKYPFPIKVLQCEKKGPGAARNIGVAQTTGSWILFVDSDCLFTPTLISGYITDNNDSIAYAGTIKIIGDDIYSNYYRDQNALHPLSEWDPTTEQMEPSTIVTANCLILKSAFEAVGGFNEGFIYAGGEDTDLGYRLKEIGRIRFNSISEAIHKFDDGLTGLIKRYIRYGKGNKKLKDIYHKDFTPNHFQPNNPTIKNKILAFITVEAMRYGYRSIK